MQLGIPVGPDSDPALPPYDVWLDGVEPTLVRVLPLTNVTPAAATTALDQFIRECLGRCCYHLAVVSPGGYEFPGLGEWTPGWPYAGLVAQFMDPHLDDEYAPGPAVWAECIQCASFGLIQTEQSWRISPCGHYDGDTGFRQPIDEALRLRWNLARERTRAAPRPG